MISKNQEESPPWRLFFARELFGVNPTGINFELYDDIPVEASHMDHPPIDTVGVFHPFFCCPRQRFLHTSSMIVISATSSKTTSV